ncbi:MAG: hypothetical protein K6A82_06060 [Prevotella sp.]|nr:hypothetical protein [Prevotella sp.]
MKSSIKYATQPHSPDLLKKIPYSEWDRMTISHFADGKELTEWGWFHRRMIQQ